MPEILSPVLHVGKLIATTEVTAPLFTGNVTGNVTGSSGSTTGNAATATALATARTIFGQSFDGTANVSGNITGTLVTAAQPNVTSLGTIAGLVTSGATTFRGIAYTWPAADGTADYVLSTSGAGVLSWIAGGGGAAAAGTLTGTTLAANVVTSSLTSVGTLTALTTSGTLTMTATASKIVPGATSFAVRNTADSADNLLVSDAGGVTARSTFTGKAAIVLDTNNSFLQGKSAAAVTRDLIGVHTDGNIRLGDAAIDIYISGVLIGTNKRIQTGVNDSGGAGFCVLRIPN